MKFVILHGTSANHESNWFPWLKAQLESLGHEVWVPDLPNSDHPNLANNSKFFQESGYDFTDSVIIGHSSGSVAIKGILQELPDGIQIDTGILVGTFRGDLGWDSLHGVDIPFDYEKIKARSKHFIVIHSDNDPYCPLDDARWVAKQLGGEFVLFPGKQHFSKSIDPSFDNFPEILKIIKEKVL